MNVIKNCLSSLNNLLGISCRSYAVSEGHVTSKFLGGVLAVKNSPVELLTHRNADFSKERFITQSALSNFGIGKGCVAVRVQEDKFTDFKNKEIQGHKETVAKVRDWCNPYENYLGNPMGRLESSSDVAKKSVEMP